MLANIAGVLKRPGRLNLWKPMRIEVIGEDESSNAQARTYAGYRVFAALAQHTQHVRGARVVLRRDKRNGTCDTRRLRCDHGAGAFRLHTHARMRSRMRMRQLTVR